jgi:6-phosphofructokinase 1
MTQHRIRKIAISTGGGDAPGLNAVIRAVVLAAHQRGWDCVGVRDGFNGLLMPEQFPEGGLAPLTRHAVAGIAHLGGTILGTTNRGNPAKFPVQQPDGSWVEEDRTEELVRRFRAAGIDAVIVVGGDGSLAIADRLARRGMRVIGVPKTIDNDLDRTFMTFGFDTAVSFASECLDRLHSTATSHRRLMVVEVMGRYAGWIALHSGIAGGANVILIPEIPFDIERVAEHVRKREREGSRSSIVVVAEGAMPAGGEMSVLGKEIGQEKKLGGIGEKVARELERRTGKEARTVVLGHLLRGGSPTSFDRLMALRFGAAAVRALEQGQSAVMVALAPPTVQYVPLAEAIRRMKTVPLNSDTMDTARDLGICFGDDPETAPGAARVRHEQLPPHE